MKSTSSGGCVVWLTGRPSSGKSTLASLVFEALRARDRTACVIDGDSVRNALVPEPGYDDDARQAFYRTLANLAALLADQGLVVLVPATAHKLLSSASSLSRADEHDLIPSPLTKHTQS